jgi:methyl-accepting chemotaxis protein
VEISRDVAGRLKAIVDRARQVDEHMAGLASDSREQSQGLEQISTTVASLDQVTQGNASTAEQSASAAAELNTQADALVHAVNRLSLLVDGKHRHPSPTDSAARPKARLGSVRQVSHISIWAGRRKDRCWGLS